MSLALAALCVLCALATESHGQVPPIPNFGIGDAMREAQPSRQPAPKQPPEPVIVQQPERPMNLPAGETLMVREFRLEGADAIPAAELQAVLDPYRGRALSMAEIEQAAGGITALFRGRGYLVARAYVPRQDASAGTLLIRVLTGTYGKLTFKNRSLVRDSTLAGAFAPLQAGGAVSRDDLERAMLLVGDMPGAVLPRLTISPGETPGTSDFDVDVGEARRFEGEVLLDNQGPRYIGRGRAGVKLDVNSPFGISDRLTIGMVDVGGGGLDSGSLVYGFPLASNGLRGELSLSHTAYRLGGEYSDLDASGRASRVEGSLRYPLLRSRGQDLFVSLSFASSRLRDEVGAAESVSNRTSRTTTLALQHDAWGDLLGHATYTGLNVGLTYGHLGIANPQERAFNRSGADTAGSFSRLKLRLDSSVELARNWRTGGTLTVQKALRDKNLDGSEQLGISGRDGVRAYREWVNGSNGYLLNLEVRYALPAGDGFTHSLGLFADLGRVYEHGCGCAAGSGTRLADVGVGYLVRSKTLFGRVQLARAVGSQARERMRDGRTHLLLQAGWNF